MSDDLQELFNSFCAFGGGKTATAELDGAKFAKLCKDSKLICKKFTTTDVDLLFSKIKVKGERKINYNTFRTAAIPGIAAKKGVSESDLIASMTHSGGPHSSGTKADNVRFHDDKEAYTGVYKHGGPSTVDTGTSDLSNICDRTDADVRGVKK
eukprot:NODE_352_length_965_cov_102.730349_g306_i0.p1 GENE.NODE_352_length_965_cov_102.730349_g306_i0~~NODE_352_length_965_cov_102.730349_g306_i0.p1  ORF type:complete len:153 (-),score=29.51 NODE_352_length_965_cov_102.730349_g306_i0:455-913(-)